MSRKWMLRPAPAPCRVVNEYCANHELPDDRTLLRQLRALERRTSPSGKDRVDHPQRVGAHDDFANSVAGASAELLSVERHSWSVTRF